MFSANQISQEGNGQFYGIVPFQQITNEVGQIITDANGAKHTLYYYSLAVSARLVGANLEVTAHCAFCAHLSMATKQQRIFVDDKASSVVQIDQVLQSMRQYLFQRMGEELMQLQKLLKIWPNDQRARAVARNKAMEIARAILLQLQPLVDTPQQIAIAQLQFPLIEEPNAPDAESSVDDNELDQNISSVVQRTAQHTYAEQFICMANDPQGQLAGIHLTGFDPDYVQQMATMSSVIHALNLDLLSVEQLAGLLITNYSTHPLVGALIARIRARQHELHRRFMAMSETVSLGKTPFIGIRFARLQSENGVYNYKQFCVNEFTKRLSHDFDGQAVKRDGTIYGGTNGIPHNVWLRTYISDLVEKCTTSKIDQQLGARFDNLIIFFMGIPIMVSMFKVIEPIEGTRYSKKTIHFCDNFVLFGSDRRLEIELREKVLGNYVFQANPGAEMVEFDEPNFNHHNLHWQFFWLGNKLQTDNGVLSGPKMLTHTGWKYPGPFCTI